MGKKYKNALRDYVREPVGDSRQDRKKIRYVYRGASYTFHMSGEELCRRKRKLSLLCALELALYLIVTMRPTPSNSSFVMIPATAGLLSIGYMCLGLFNLLTSGRKLPEWEYQAMKSQLKWGSILSMGLFFVTFITQMVFLVGFLRELPGREFISCAGYLALAGIAYVIFSLWRGILFDVDEGDEQLRRQKELQDDIEHAFGDSSDFR